MQGSIVFCLFLSSGPRILQRLVVLRLRDQVVPDDEDGALPPEESTVVDDFFMFFRMNLRTVFEFSYSYYMFKIVQDYSRLSLSYQRFLR